MSMECRGENKWRFRIRKDGVNYTQNFYGTEKEAEKAHKIFEVDIMKGNIGINENILFRDFVELYNKEYMVQLKGSSKKLYISVCDNHLIPEFGHIEIGKIKKIHIQKFINSLTTNVSPATVRSYYKELNKTFNKAIEWELIKNNPCQNIQLPPKPKNKYTELLSTEQIKTLMKAIDNLQDDIFKVIISIALYSGMRQAEILALKINDINFKNNSINVNKQYGITIDENNKVKRELINTKTENSIRTVYIPEHLTFLIKNYIKNLKILDLNGHLFYIQKSNNIVSREYVTKKFRDLLLINELPHIRFHDLRHLYATMMINSGVNVVAVAQNLGDTIETVLSNYTHGIEDLRKKSVNTFDTFTKNIKSS